jgi:hypothetical protein
VTTALAPYGTAQQPPWFGPQPICGNSVVWPGAFVTAAKYGWLQLPVNNGRPSNDTVTLELFKVASSSTTLPVIVEISEFVVDVASVV